MTHSLRKMPAALIKMSVAVSVSALVAAAASPALAVDGKQIFETAKARYEERVAKVDSVTIVQDVMGMESTTRLEKYTIEDEVFLGSSDATKTADFGSMYRYFDELAERAVLKGTESVDGEPCWVVDVTDLESVRLGTEGSADFVPSDGTLHIDKQQYVLRRMVMNGTMNKSGKPEPVTMEMHVQDYREVDGWLHPFRHEMVISGEGEVDAEIARMGDAMAEMKKQLANMPPEQRQMMEQMMKSRIPDFEKATEGGKLTVAVTVKEVRVNEPAP